MLGWSFGIKGIALAAAIALFAGFGAGWQTRDWKCDAAAERARAEAAEAKLATANATIARQQSDINTLNGLRAKDAQRAKDDLEAERRNQENINATPHNPSGCLDLPAARRVLQTR